MTPPRRRRAKRLRRLLALTVALSRVVDLITVIDHLTALEPVRVKQRRTLLVRKRRAFADYIRPMLVDGTFALRFRMEHEDFMVLVEYLRPTLQRDERMGALRNGAVPVEYQVALTLRWLAGGSMYEGIDGHVIARSTAYQTAFRVIDALNACPELNCKWPEGRDVPTAANLFANRSSSGVIRKCVGAMDGLFVRTIKPSVKDTPEPNSFYSGRKEKGFGMNFQAICDAQYRIIAWTMNCPGSQNDRTAFKFSGFDKLINDLPPDHFIVGDAAYPASDRVLVPYTGTSLSASQEAYNFYQSQARMAIEQTFGILVRRWGILWRPMKVRLKRFPHVVNAVVRLHNFCRDRKLSAPSNDVQITLPPELAFHADGRIDGDYFETAPGRAGRPVEDQVRVSKPREDIRVKLEIAGMVRPTPNLARDVNRSR